MNSAEGFALQCYSLCMHSGKTQCLFRENRDSDGHLACYDLPQ